MNERALSSVLLIIVLSQATQIDLCKEYACMLGIEDRAYVFRAWIHETVHTSFMPGHRRQCMSLMPEH